MTRNLRLLLNCSIFALLPFMANAAGTYYNYNGTVQRNYTNHPFYNYGANDVNRLHNQVVPQQNGCMTGGCGNMGNADNGNMYSNMNQKSDNNTRNTASRQNTSSGKGGFQLDAGMSHQFAVWKFDMSTAGSELHYDNLNWNVFDVSAKYDFDWGKTKLRLGGGIQYGMQYGESTMIDDDITNGGYSLNSEWTTAGGEVGSQQAHALSIGTTSGGDMFGFHAGIGLVDFWRFGNLRVTPSVGYRHFKYKLETKSNYGMSVDTFSASNYCDTRNGETQCVPFLVFVRTDADNAVDAAVVGDSPVYGYIQVPNGVELDDSSIFNAEYVEAENTYYYYQDGVSHSYEVEWSGPYLALDMDYDISQRDALNARMEFGLPAYKSTADQPYRPDWQHPTSLEDKGSIGDAYHFGLGANWLHSLSNSVMLTVGLTFDYYHISGADAITYLNPDYYMGTYYYNEALEANSALIEYYGSVQSEWPQEAIDAYNYNIANIIEPIEELASEGWKTTTSDEIESLYKSLGIRIGIQAKF